MGGRKNVSKRPQLNTPIQKTSEAPPMIRAGNGAFSPGARVLTWRNMVR